ncbi:hypothetical protein [Nocardia terpenica]|uniref:Uncharacterized protein n=1 Tax=Nocardia terpenica TaxID=455432 RepID=A0A6G9ZED7_9NOCA|nr:hypothetical protein [Nocardia terpenica]QIS23466.1 hypothetical protein F6W96_39340 [Nocardia terpenica]
MSPEDSSDRPTPVPRPSFGFLADIPISELHRADVQMWFEMLDEERLRNPGKAERLRDRLQRVLRIQDPPLQP